MATSWAAQGNFEAGIAIEGNIDVEMLLFENFADQTSQPVIIFDQKNPHNTPSQIQT